MDYSAHSKMASLFLAVAFLSIGFGRSRADAGIILVSDNGNKIREFNSTTGAAITDPLITGVNRPIGIAVSGNNIYEVSENSNTVGKFTITGATVVNPFITGLRQPFGIVATADKLFVSNVGTSTIGTYDINTGAAINAALVTNVSDPYAIALSDNYLLVVSFNGSSLTEYNATTGAKILTLASNLNQPFAVAADNGIAYVACVSGTVSSFNIATGALINPSLISVSSGGFVGISVADNNIYVLNQFSNTVGEYTLGGTPVNTALVTGLNNPEGIMVLPDAVPEPASLALLAIPGLLLSMRRLRAKHTRGMRLSL